MGKEIERKFTVKPDSDWKALSIKSEEIRQGYLSRCPEATVRLRVKGPHAFLTVKGLNHGAVRDEWEYEIPVADAEEMALALLPGGFEIDKTRHLVPAGDLTWEIDEFHGRLQGLVLAEVELPRADVAVEIPSFVEKEVTDDPRYYNSNLARAGSAPAPR